MKIKTLFTGKTEVAYLISPEILIKNAQDALDLIGNISPSHIILSAHNFEKDFFDLKTRKLGEILQKFTNYRVKLAVIGSFENASGALKDFIYESNKHGDYLFISSLSAALSRWHS